jgi:DNA-directed RNA polymerase specialized sigma24 family protein
MAKFPSTRWSLIVRSGHVGDGRQAFGDLARLYRPAIVAFFRAKLGPDSAEDAAQSFLTASFERVWWSRADAELGSFRSFLLMLLRRHLGHLRAASAHADSNPGDVDEAVDETPGADRQFDGRFVLLLTANAVEAQRQRYRERDRGALFEQLLPLLSSPPEHGELKDVAASLQIPSNTLTVELQRLRKRLREEMHAQLEDLCADETTVAAEWALLQGILAGA